MGSPFSAAQKIDRALLRVAEFFFGPRDDWRWWQHRMEALGGVRCDICGEWEIDREVYFRGWTDEGLPLLTCGRHGSPDA